MHITNTEIIGVIFCLVAGTLLENRRFIKNWFISVQEKKDIQFIRKMLSEYDADVVTFWQTKRIYKIFTGNYPEGIEEEYFTTVRGYFLWRTIKTPQTKYGDKILTKATAGTLEKNHDPCNKLQVNHRTLKYIYADGPEIVVQLKRN